MDPESEVELMVPGESVAAPRVSVEQRLAELRSEAADEVRSRRDDVGRDQARLDQAKAALARACAVALDAGLPAGDVAQLAGVSSGTVRAWAKDREGT